MDADGHVAGSLDVRDALGELIGKHLVHRLGVLLEDVVRLARRVVELAVADLVMAQRRVDDGELHRGVGGEIVVDIAHRREDGLLVVVAGVLVGDVVEGKGLGVVALLDLADAVLEHSVVADGIDHVLGVVSATSLLGGELVALGAALLELLGHLCGAFRLRALRLLRRGAGIANLMALAGKLAVELLMHLLDVALALPLAHLRKLGVEFETDLTRAAETLGERLHVLEALVLVCH